MDFITQETITELGLTEAQISGLTPKFNDFISNKQKEWDGLANTNAENIITGAVKTIQSKVGINEDRQQGEKIADYLIRVSDKALEVKQNNVTKLEQEYQQKLKDFKGDEATKSELDQAKKELDDAKKILATYDEVKGKADKYEEASQQLNGLKLEVAFGSAKPNFPDTVNPYEVKAKWDEFKSSVLEKYTIELVEGVPMAIDKENQYKQIKLSELVKENKELSELLTGRQQKGTGTRSRDGSTSKIEGVPFDVPDEAKTNSAERSKAIKEFLLKEGLNPTNKEWSDKFSDYNKKIMSAK